MSQTNSQRCCLWCGAESTPENRLTLEHIVPLWMHRALEGQGPARHAFTEWGEASPTREWTTELPDFKARVACRQCNNGWLSALEGRAKRRLPALMHGVPTSLSRVDCEILARWAAKTAMTFQASERTENKVVPREAFHDLMDVATGVPRTMRVWVAAVPNARGVSAHAFGGELRQSGRAVSHFTVLASFDQVAFMVMGSSEPAALAAVDLGRLGSGFVELSHAQTGASWPPVHPFEPEHFGVMSELLPRLAQVRSAAAR